MTRLVACAVVRHDPPDVYTAEDLETLNWVLALKVVAATRGGELSPGIRDQLRAALLGERWGEAVELWIEASGIPVDVYPSMELYVPSDIELAPMRMQFMSLFED